MWVIGSPLGRGEVTDRGGNFWVVTTAGLNKFNTVTGEAKVYKEKDGLPNDSVLAIVEDAQGYLWISTNHGLARFHSEREQFKVFGTQDGLQSLEFNGRSALLTRNGEIYFGGINGLNRFNPLTLKENW